MNKKIVQILVGLAFICVFFTYLVELSKFKPFWIDEGIAQFITYAQSASSMLIEGTSNQCSRAPLYYLAQKPFLTGIHFFTESILVQYRWVSLLSALVAMGGLFFFFNSALGFASALLLFAPLGFHPSFAYYANESRPYLFWLSLFTLNFIFIFRLKKMELKRLLPALMVNVALAMAVTPGFVQVGVFYASLIAFVYFIEKNRDRLYLTKLFQFSGLAVLLSTACGTYYAIKGCPSISGGAYDFLDSSWKGRYELVYHVWQLFWPTMGIFSQFLNILLVVGLLSPLLSKWWPPTVPTTHHSIFRGLALIVPQTLLALPIAVLTARSHYFFVPRLFIFLMACRTILVVLGFSYFCSLFNSKKIQLAALAFALVLSGRSIYNLDVDLTAKRAAVETKVDPAFEVQIDCSEWIFESYGLWYQKARDSADLSNAIVGLDKALKKCPLPTSGLKQEVRFAVLYASPNMPFVFKVDPTAIESLEDTRVPVGFGDISRLLQNGYFVSIKRVP